MPLRLLDFNVRRLDIATRMPFKYGIAVMTDLPHVLVTVRALIGGAEATGQSADHLPPKWFTKEPGTSPQEDIAGMEAVLAEALEAAKDIVADSPFEFWMELHNQLMSPPRHPPLLQHFGISLVERALLDAFCQHHGQPLWQLVRSNALGIDLGRLSPELTGYAPADFLPERPLESAQLRHTVGMADFLREAVIGPEERLDDGLPQSLEACIDFYGLREFKLKLTGNAGADLDRLRGIADVIHRKLQGDYRFSLDGNEQFSTPGQLRSFGEEVYADPKLNAFFEHLFFIEQPIHRKAALADDAPDVSAAWPCPVPIIIDESDGDLNAFPRALELGYAGVSHKNCKGVFKGIRNRCLVGYHQSRHPDRQLLMTGEDLANIGPIALLQDLAVQALLGNTSIERNGHHYFKGLGMFPQEVSRKMLDQHPDLYRPGPDQTAFLRVESGRLSLHSVNAAPFGTSCRVPDSAGPG